MLREYLFIGITIAGTVVGQVLVKKGMSEVGEIPNTVPTSLLFLAEALLNLKVILGFASAFIAALAWMAALSRLPLSFAYPFMSVSFILVLLIAWMILGEKVTLARWLGVGLIFLGVFFVSRS